MSVPCSVVTKGSLRPRGLRRHHLARQQRAHRMRNGIVHVQQIEVVKLGHLRHPRRQRQIVRRIFEQRITGDFHFVIVNVGMGPLSRMGCA